MTAISRSKVKIYIVAAGTNASALAATDIVTGEIKSYAKSGGDDSVESDPVFGGFVDKEKPASQLKLEFDVIPSLESADRWDALVYGTVNNVYTSNTVAANKAVFIQALTGTGTYKSWGFNNCNGVSWDFDHNADDNQTGKFSFNLSPADSSGIANFMTKAVAVTTLPAWSTLTS